MNFINLNVHWTIISDAIFDNVFILDALHEIVP